MKLTMDLTVRPRKVSGGNQREHWIGKIVRSGLEEKMKELKRAGLNEQKRWKLVKKKERKKHEIKQKSVSFCSRCSYGCNTVPATNAQAASTAKLSATKATVYSEGYKTVTVKTPKSWKSVKVTATSSKKSVATVKKTAAKKIKVTGVKPGTAKVTVKVTYKTSTKKSAKTKTKKLTYTMKVAKASVALSGDSVVAVGDTTTLTTTKKASKRATITYTSSDDSIATVSEDGTVKGVKAGKATITATLKIGKDTATATQDVEVKNVILKSVAQKKASQIVATFAGDTSKLDKKDITITNTANNVVYPVKAISVAADKKTVKIDTYSEMNDAKEYSVKYDEQRSHLLLQMVLLQMLV